MGVSLLDVVPVHKSFDKDVAGSLNVSADDVLGVVDCYPQLEVFLGLGGDVPNLGVCLS